jgi:hypothetical protein
MPYLSSTATTTPSRIRDENGMIASNGSSAEQVRTGRAAFSSGAARRISSRSSSIVSGLAID